ncbi:outer membrane cobalamin receptor [Pseudoxanthomonas broegbernensis]|nr:outer membrane cobalamin receptor [Pseudoxanthomonas broegbernensis]
MDTMRGAGARPSSAAWRAAAAIVLSFAAGALPAQEPPEPAVFPAHDLDEVRVTATVLPTAAIEASQNVTVLRREDLEAWRGRSLAEVLAGQAGLMVDRSARGGGYGALYLRGADPSHVVVLVDHVRQNDPLSSRGSAVDLNTLALEEIERIEIVRGNASVAHAEAVAGLVHVFTRRPAEGASAGIAAGGDGLRAVRAGLSGQGWRIAASDREDGDGRRGFQGVRAFDAGWARELGQALSLRAAFRYGDSRGRGFPDDSGGPRHAVLRELDARSATTRQFSLMGEFRPAAGTVEAQWATFSRRGEDSSPGVAGGLRDPAGLPALAARTDYRRDELQATWRLPLGAGGGLGAGVLHQRERGRYDGRIDFGFFQLPTAFAMQRRTDAAFAELRWRHGPWTAQGGLRHERRHDAGAGTGSATHPMLSLQRRAGADGAHWGASFSRSSKPPSFYALGHPLVGNPGLRPERAEQRELYYANADDAAWPSRLTLFAARYRDLVDFDGGPPPRLVNRARIEAEGLEWRTRHHFDNDWRLSLDGAWMRVRDPLDGIRLRHRPRLQAGAELAVPLDGRHELSLWLHHLGRRFDSSIPTGDRWLEPATTLDLALRRHWGRAIVLLALDNATDARDEEVIGLEAPGRRLRLSLQWDM